jgi:hypothetical protein
MKIFSIVTIFLVVLIMLSACSNDNPTVPTIDYEPEVNVFGLLILNRQQKTIRVEQTYKVTDYFPDFRGVEDAKVWIHSKTQNVQFEHLFNGNYSDKYQELLLVAGETYLLDITMANGKKITSECVVPAPPQILSPNDNEAVTAFQALDVHWKRGEFSERYQIAVDDEFRNFKFSNYSDSTYSHLFPFIFAKSGRYNLKIASMDKNYWDHLRTGDSRQPVLNISGAIGVFGAIAYDKTVFYAY